MRSSSFTLIELLIVIAIAAILAGTLVPMFSVTKQNAKLAKAMTELDAIKEACKMFHLDTGAWPHRFAGYGYMLINNVGDLSGWNGPYLDEWPIQDPWGRSYVLVETSFIWNDEVEWTTGPENFLVTYSAGRDGQLDSTDPYVLITRLY